MSEGLTKLEMKIAEFEQAQDDLKEVVREAHSVLKQIRHERREVEELLRGPKIKRLMEERISEVVKKELEELGPGIRKQTNEIYAKVDKEVDRLINIMLGPPYSSKEKKEDLRSMLAAKLQEWIREIIRAEGFDIS